MFVEAESVVLPRFRIGAMEKVSAGARFFQTQAVYDITSFENFLSRVKHLNVSIIAGVMPIKSVKMARYANEKIPGITIPEDLIRRVLDATPGVVVLDEAYTEYTGYTSLPLLQEYPNLVITRTFSKAFALAAMRIGFAITSPEIAPCSILCE